MVAAGLLVPDGTLPLFPLLSGAILGAVLGDGVSWELGRRYGHLLDNRWPFTRRPDLMTRGTASFRNTVWPASSSGASWSATCNHSPGRRHREDAAHTVLVRQYRFGGDLGTGASASR